MARFFSTLLLLFVAHFVFSQNTIFEGNSIKSETQFEALMAQFEKSEVYRIDVNAFNDFVKEGGTDISFDFKFGNEMDLSLNIEPRDVRHPDYTFRVAEDEGITEYGKSENITFRGYVTSPGGGRVALTVDDDFIYGFFKVGNETYFIEPLWYFVPDQPKDLFVVYAESDVKESGGTCGAEELHHFKEKNTPHQHGHGHGSQGQVEMMGCFEIELAIASDFLMFQKYGSVGAVEGHNIAVLNNVQTNYDDEFNDELSFFIITQFVATSAANDPWTTSTNAGTLLSNFRSWGNSGGFGVPFDLGELWTDRNFNGGTIGVAYLNAVCGFSRYHVLEDFSSNASLLRVLVSHEIGHNFGATHDPGGSGTIMAPAVNNTNTWSAQSINQINNFYSGISCLAACAPSQPPVANFTFFPNEGCAPLTVNFQDQSAGATDWNWTFPGGNPTSSTAQNPTVTYNSPGTYSVTLEASNGAGSNTVTQNDVIFVDSPPIAAFDFDLLGLTVVFDNISTPNATSFLWDFGDTNTSTEENPVHTYAEDGFYDVTLTATNDCGSTMLSLTLPVFTAPNAGFVADPAEGCASLDVQFTNGSSENALNFAWEFDGGSPATSSEENPLVTYASPGVYSVTLTVTNPAGSDMITETDLITVGTVPTPGFNFMVDGSTVTFTNTSDNANGIGPMTYEWDFGDMTTSTEENPVHTYTGNGDFDVTLTVSNDCGSAEITQTVNIEVPPTAGFSANSTSGCEPFEVTFNNNSSANSNEYEWSFPGGSPTSSTEENPTITYSAAGTYDVTLIVINGAGSDTLTFEDYITVAPLAIPGFTSTFNGPTYTFTNTSQNATSYLWDFGDNNTSTEVDPVHTYTETGTFTVTLTATNSCGSITTTQTVEAVTAPTSSFSGSPRTGCAPHTVEYTNESSENATSFEWDFPGGNPSSSTEENPTVTYDTPGTYSATLTVFNSAGSSTSTQTNYVVVAGGPTAGFNSSTNSFVANFTNTSSNATSYEWDFGDMNTSTETNPEHTYDEDGTYTVTLTATNSCGTDVFTQTVVITSLPQAGFSAGQTTGCAPFEVMFTNESSENATSFEWDFPGGSPSSSTMENPVVTYDTPGAYSVTLTAFNSLGESTVTETNYILVGTTPNAEFTSEEDMLTVTFTNSSTNPAYSGGLSYEWDFGDMNTSTETNPTHTYAEDGTYEVTLTVTNDCGSNTYTLMVSVVSTPSAGFSTSQTMGCAPFEVEFTNESSENATSFEWDFPGGSPSSSTMENPVVTYDSPGTYSVTLTASNAAGSDMVTQTDIIVVGSNPLASFTSTEDLLTVTFTSMATNPANSGALEYDWDFGDMNTSTEENPVHTYAEDGTYDVTLTVTNDCGSVSFMQTVTVATVPTANFTAQNTSGCAPFEVQFNNASTANAETFEWSFPGGDPSSSTEENPVVTYNAAGTYDVTLTVTNSAGESTSTQMEFITVDDVPVANFSSDVVDNTATFTNNSTNATSYEWDFGDMNTSTEASPTHTYAEDGAYTVILTATNDCGSTTTEELVVIATQGQAPVAAFSAEAREGCAPLSVTFENSSANATEFEWTFPGGEPTSSTEENPTVTYNTPGTYDVTLVATNMNGSDTFEEIAYVVVGGLPAAGFTFDTDNETVTFTNTSTNAVNSGDMTFEWNFGDTNTSNEENPVHTYAEPGEYTVTLTVMNECGISASTTTVTIMANSVGELPGISEFNVFPNPNRGVFTLVLEGQGQPELDIIFTNVLGQVLMTQPVDFRSGSLRQEFAFDDLASGTYIIQVRSGDRALHRKLIVE